MGLRAVIAGGVNTAFRALGDIPQAAVYHVKTPASYDPVVGTNAATNADHTLPRVLLEEFDRKVVDGQQILATDRKLSFPSDNLPVTAKAQDTITVAGQDWRVIQVLDADPAGAMTILQVRL